IHILYKMTDMRWFQERSELQLLLLVDRATPEAARIVSLAASVMTSTAPIRHFSVHGLRSASHRIFEAGHRMPRGRRHGTIAKSWRRQSCFALGINPRSEAAAW